MVADWFTEFSTQVANIILLFQEIEPENRISGSAASLTPAKIG
jgi:hypothetical protein